jgi:RNA polymerase sigma-70 factor (TIGR02943 family)
MTALLAIEVGETRSLTDPKRWVQDHGDVLYRFAMLRLHDDAAAEEVVQETFLAGMKSKANFSGRSSERTWLVGILKHKIVDYFRKRGRERPSHGADAAETLQEVDADFFDASGHWRMGPAGWITDPQQSRERAEIRESMVSCMEDLPTRQAQAFTLRELEGHEAEAICELLGVTRNNLHVMLHRARLGLRGCLEADWVVD